MDLGTWALVIGGVIGLAEALFGLRVWCTGRAPARTIRVFRSTRDAGLYLLLFGVALVVLVAGTQAPGESAGGVATPLAILLAGVAAARYRPRKKAEQQGER
ncbi:MAG: hypothetical protein ABWX96_22370 [Propionibacteriaceae bacterium]